MSKKLIQNDEQYNAALGGLVKLGIELEDPLLPEDKRQQKQAIYDRTAELIQYYRRGQQVQKYPGLRQQYEILGWKWQDLGEAKTEPSTDPKPTPEQIEPPEPVRVPENEPQDPQQPVKEKPKKNLSSWLDD